MQITLTIWFRVNCLLSITFLQWWWLHNVQMMGQDRPFSSLNSAAHFSTVDKFGASFSCMSFGIKPIFCRWCQILSIFMRSHSLLVSFEIFFEQSDVSLTRMQLLIRKIEVNACKIPQLWHYSFIVCLWTFWPILVNPTTFRCFTIYSLS